MGSTSQVLVQGLPTSSGVGGGRLCFLRPHLGLTLPPRPGEPVCVSHTTAPPHPCRAGVKGGEGPVQVRTATLFSLHIRPEPFLWLSA